MKSIPSNPGQVALCCFFALTLQAHPLLAQTGMTPEEEAIYRSMMKSAGIDPDEGMDALEQNEASQQFTEGDGNIVDYHIVGVYEAQGANLLPRG